MINESEVKNLEAKSEAKILALLAELEQTRKVNQFARLSLASESQNVKEKCAAQILQAVSAQRLGWIS